jgi:Baseplate J-like protein
MTLPDIQLDPRNEWELYEQAQDHVFKVSGGQLGSRNPADPLAFLLEGQVYAGAELLWYVNQLPSKLLTQWLSYWGLTTDDGAIATGSVTVQLAQVNAVVTIPAGTLFSAGDVLFRSTQSVDAPANSMEISVPIEATEPGTQGNVPGYGIQSIVTPIPYAKSASNPLPTSGGRDPQSAEEAIALFVDTARDGMLISEADYVSASLRFLGGNGWQVRVLSNTDPLTGLSVPGSVAVLVANPEYNNIPNGTLISLDRYLRQRSVLTIQPYVIEMGRFDVTVRVTVQYDRSDDPQLVADNLVAGIYSHLASNMGESISERDMVLIAEDAGCVLGTASFNNSPMITTPSLREVLYPKYIEVRLSPVKDGYPMDANDTRQLFGSGDQSQLFIYGEGEGDALL